jgi:hypothetical protein
VGAGKWRDEYTEFLEATPSVTIWADADEPGRDHAANVRDALLPWCSLGFGSWSPATGEGRLRPLRGHGLALIDVAGDGAVQRREDTETWFLPVADEYIDQDYQQRVGDAGPCCGSGRCWC